MTHSREVRITWSIHAEYLRADASGRRRQGILIIIPKDRNDLRREPELELTIHAGNHECLILITLIAFAIILAGIHTSIRHLAELMPSLASLMLPLSSEWIVMKKMRPLLEESSIGSVADGSARMRLLALRHADSRMNAIIEFAFKYSSSSSR